MTSSEQIISNEDDFISYILGSGENIVKYIEECKSLSEWLDSIPYQESRRQWEDIALKLWDKYRWTKEDRCIEWSSWMEKYDVFHAGESSVYALIDYKTGLIQAASNECKGYSMLISLMDITGEKLQRLDFDLVKIENASLNRHQTLC